MQKDFILPDIGEGIVECEIVAWLVAEGERIEEDQPVAEVMTDKAMVQIPAMYSGVVQQFYYQTGDMARVHQPLFAMTVEQELPRDATAAATTAVASSDESSQPVTSAAIDEQGRVEEDFILPDIGEGIVECELVKWWVQEGDSVAEDQVVAEVMTDKAMVEIPAKHTGVITALYCGQGEIAKVHTPLYRVAITAVDGINSDVLDSNTTQCVAPAVTDTEQTAAPPRGKAVASPAVRRRAREMGIDISVVAGSGSKGRVMKEDLARHQLAKQDDAATTDTAPTQTLADPRGSDTAAKQALTGGSRTEAISGVKAAMARQMTESMATIPHFTVSDEVSMDALIETRRKLQPEFEQLGIKLTFMPFFIKALSLALQQFPVINARVNSDCSAITYFDDHNIGMAVDSKIGLVVPNIKRVNTLSLMEIARECHRLVELAREGRLRPTELSGGTVTISNIGVLGGTVATPVINAPEAAIVALGKMQKLPRFDENDRVRAVNLMTVSWSGDHRIIDGATMVKFNNLWTAYLQEPVAMLAHLR